MDLLIFPTTAFPLLLADGLKYAVANLSAFSLLIFFVLIGVFCWGLSLMLSKNTVITEEERKLTDFQEQLDRTSNPLAIFSNRNPPDGSLVDYQYRVGCRELCVHLIGTADPDEHFAHRLRHAGKIAPPQIQLVRQASDRAMAEGRARLEQNQFFLQSSILAAPGLGLLGTLLAYIGHYGSASHDLSAGGATSATAWLAPALLTSALGLFLGIVFYLANCHLQRRKLGLQFELRHFSEGLLSGFERLYLDHATSGNTPAPDKAEEASAPFMNDASSPATEAPDSASPAAHENKGAPLVLPALQPEVEAKNETVEKPLPAPAPAPIPADGDFILHEANGDKGWIEEDDFAPLFQDLSHDLKWEKPAPASPSMAPDATQEIKPAGEEEDETPAYFSGETEVTTELGNKLRELRQTALRMAANTGEILEPKAGEEIKTHTSSMAP